MSPGRGPQSITHGAEEGTSPLEGSLSRITQSYSSLSPQPVSAGCSVFQTRPKLAAWQQRVEEEVGTGLFQEAHEVVLKAKDLPPVDIAMKDQLKPLVEVLL